MDPIWIWPVLFLTGLTAGFVDSIAGGGGLITIPVLLNLGLPPQDALGTNKLQATFGSGSAAYHYGCAGLFRWRDCLTGIVCTAAGALAGSLAVLHVSADFLRQLIPWLLMAIAAYLVVRPRLGMEERPARLEWNTFHVLFGLGLGFYDGFFGPGTGSFWAMAYLLGRGLDLTKATGHTKLMNFTSNLVSLLLFAGASHVLYGAGLVMGLGQLTGARLGSKTVIARGTRFIRPIFLTVVVAITCKLIYENLSRKQDFRSNPEQTPAVRLWNSGSKD